MARGERVEIIDGETCVIPALAANGLLVGWRGLKPVDGSRNLVRKGGMSL